MDGRHRTQGQPPPAPGVPIHPPPPPTSYSQNAPSFAQPPPQAKRPPPAQKQPLPQASQQASQAPIPQLHPQDIVNACDTLVAVARGLNSRPVYDTQRVGGEDHQPLFHASLKLIPQGYSTRGVGHSKLSSRRDAACNMLRIIYSKTIPPLANTVTGATNLPQPSSPSHSLPGQLHMQPASYPVTQARQVLPIRSYASVPHPSQGRIPHPGEPQPPPMQQAPGQTPPFHAKGKQEQLQPQPPIQQHQSQHHQMPHVHQQYLHQQSYQQQQMPQHPYTHLPSQGSQYQPQQPQAPAEQEVQPAREKQEEQQEKQNDEEQEPMFYVDRSPDSELERELEEEEEQQKQLSVQEHTLQPSAPDASTEAEVLKPVASNSEPSLKPATAAVPQAIVSQPVNKSVLPMLRSKPVPVSTSELTSGPLRSSSMNAAPSAPPKPLISVAATPISSNPAQDARVAVAGPSSTSAAPTSQNQSLTIGASVAAEMASTLPAALTPKRESHPPEPVGAPSTRPSNLLPISVKTETSVLPEHALSLSDGNTVPTATPSMKRKLEHAETDRNANGSTNGSAAVEQARKKAKPPPSNPSVRIELHFLCIYSDVIIGCLQNLLGADLFMQPVIRMFTSAKGPIGLQFSPNLNVEVKPFSCSVLNDISRINVALAFEAGAISNEMWVARAKHLEKGLSSVYWPQLIILNSDPCFDIFKKKGVTEVIKPSEDVVSHVSGILQHIADCEAKRNG